MPISRPLLRQQGHGAALILLALAACTRAASPTAVPAPATAPLPSAAPASPSATARAATSTQAAPSATATQSPQPSPTETASLTPPPTPTADPCLARHTVQAGERLYRIGLLYGVDWQAIARANDLADASLIYPGQVLCIPAGGGAAPGTTSTPLPPPTGQPSPAATGTPVVGSGQPVILTFAAYPPESAPGATITLAWTSSGGTSALLVEPICCQSNGSNLTREVPPNGSAKDSLGGAVERDTLVYTLFVTGPSGAGSPSASQSVEVRLPCPDSYFFDAPAGSLACPAGPAVSTPAVEQLFEGGRMIWLGALKTILVLFGDGAPPNGPGLPPDGYISFPDTWTPGEAESDPTLIPPAGRVQPVRGFGKVWRGELVPGQLVRDALGWALAPEQPYTGIYQRPWATCLSAGADEIATSCSGPAPIEYLRSADSRLIRVAEFGALGGHSIAQWQFWSPPVQ